MSYDYPDDICERDAKILAASKTTGEVIRREEVTTTTAAYLVCHDGCFSKAHTLTRYATQDLGIVYDEPLDELHHLGAPLDAVPEHRPQLYKVTTKVVQTLEPLTDESAATCWAAWEAQRKGDGR